MQDSQPILHTPHSASTQNSLMQGNTLPAPSGCGRQRRWRLGPGSAAGCSVLSPHHLSADTSVCTDFMVSIHEDRM